jgi:uncharacterized membrane protein
MSRLATPIRPRSHAARRRGVYIWELVVVVPLILMLLLGVIEYGFVYINQRHLAMAARTGAKVAAEQAIFDINAIKDEVDRHLLSAGFASGSTEVVLQHNVGSPMTIVVSSLGAPVGPYPTGPALPDATLLPEGCVRVSVVVPFTLLTPDLLAAFGLSLSTQKAQQTTTLAYEAL